jgi:hypothetical protein
MVSPKNVQEILLSKASHLLKEERCNKTVVIGVPHHAPVGVDRLPCNRWADENTGFLGRYMADKLDCNSIIACNYFVDANKNMNNDYSEQLVRWNPKLLVEVHGHKRKRTKNDIEISCGCLERNTSSISLAEKIREKCQGNPYLRWLKICGDYNNIFFKAGSVKTITYGGWMGYLIELPPELRYEEKQNGGKPPLIGYTFCDYFVECLRETEW